MKYERLRRSSTGRPHVYAHRGSHQRAPENSVKAFSLAIEENADGAEMDVRLCASGELVVIHDADLRRVTGDRGEVGRLSMCELRARDLGDGERIPVMHEVLDLLMANDRVAHIEVKSDSVDRRRLAYTVSRAVKRRHSRDHSRMVLSTFDPQVLLWLWFYVPEIPIAFLFDRKNTGVWRATIARRILPIDGVHPQHELAVAKSVHRWRQRGLFVNAWTLLHPSDVRRVAATGVDGIITDDVPMVRRVFGG